MADVGSVATKASIGGWNGALQEHTERRKKEREARWQEALVYFRQITKTSADAPDFTKPVTLDKLLDSIQEQNQSYDEFRAKPEAPLPVPKKKHRLFHWTGKKDDAPTDSKLSDEGSRSLEEGTPRSLDGPTEEAGSNSTMPASQAYKRMLIDKVKATYGPIQLIGRMTIDTFGQTYPGVAYAFGSVFFLIQTARGVSELYDAIQDFFGLIKPFLDRLAVYAQRELSPELEDLVTDVLIAIIRVNGIAADIISRNRAAQYLRVVIGKDERIARELAALRELFENEGRMVGALLLREFQEKLARPILAVEDAPRAVHDMRARLEDLKAKLRPITAKGAPENVLRSTSMRRASDTGTWILSEPAFKSWLEREVPVLWVSGGPGAGKTFLSSSIIQHLLETISLRANQIPPTAVAYFFCKSDVPELCTFENVLRTMSFQICTRMPAFADHVASACPDPAELDAETLWLRLFNDFFEDPPGHAGYAPVSAGVVYLVFDGLDEVTEAKQRRSFLKTLGLSLKRNEECGKRIQILMLGRPELTPEIESALRKNLLTISVSAQKNSADIEKYIRETVDDGRLSDTNIPEKHRQEFVRKISERAEGMFLWADLMIDEMALKDDFQEMQRALRKAPLELKGKILNTLDQLGKSLDREKIADLNEILKWVTCAQRRLTLSELKTILNTKQGRGGPSEDFELDYEDEMFQFESSLRKRYSSLLTLIREDGLSTEDLRDELKQRDIIHQLSSLELRNEAGNSKRKEGALQRGVRSRVLSSPNTEVTIAHASIREFLQQEQKTTEVGVDINEAHSSIALHLLTRICDSGSPEDTLFQYACNEWQRHLTLAKLEQVRNLDLAKLAPLIIRLLRNEKTCKRWMAQVQSFWQLWIWNEDNQRQVQEWLSDPAIAHGLPDSDRSWISHFRETPEHNILRLPYEICATEWLKRYDWMGPPCFENVAAYKEMMACLKSGSPLPLAPTTPNKSDANYIREVAQWTGFEQNTVWHGRLAFTLRQLNHIHAAIGEHELALAQGNYLPSLAGLAYCYEDLGDLPKAVDCMGQALARLEDPTYETQIPPIPQKAIDMYMNSIGEWMARINNQEGARAAWEKLSSQSRSNSAAITNLLNLLYAEGKYKELISMLEHMGGNPIAGQKHTSLTQLCLQWYSGGEEQLPYCPGIEDAALQEGKIDIIRDMYISAVDAAERMGDVTLMLLLKTDLAQVLYRYYDRDAEAMAMLGRIARFKHGKVGTRLYLVRAVASNRLQEMYMHEMFTQQATVTKNLLDHQRIVEGFEDLIEAGKEGGTDSVHTNVDPDDPLDFASLRLASLYTLSARKRDAKLQLRGTLTLGLDMLAKQRFLEGVQCLLRVFLASGDDVNALAAFSMLSRDSEEPPAAKGSAGAPADSDGAAAKQQPAATIVVVSRAKRPDDDESVEIVKTEVSPDTDPMQLDEHALKLARVCDGCGRESPKPDGFFHCRSCTDIDWCPDCMERLECGELRVFPPRKCARMHSFLHIPEWEDRLEKGKIRVGKEQWELDRWIRAVKEEWSKLDVSTKS